MVIRYGAINENDGEVYNEEPDNEDNLSESSISSFFNYKSIFLGKGRYESIFFLRQKLTMEFNSILLF